MPHYSIKEVSELIGIKAPTIRMWEQRYNMLAASKHAKSHRRSYTEDDLRHLLNIVLLNRHGLKISNLARMPEEEIKEKVLELAETHFDYDTQIDALVVAMVNFNETSFNKIIATNILRHGFEDTFLNLIFPFLRKVGLLWQTAIIRPSHEHFVSAIVRQRLCVAIEGQGDLHNQGKSGLRFLLFLPENEAHELTLLFINYVLRSRGHHTLYLGSSISLDEVAAAKSDYFPSHLVTVFTSLPPMHEMQPYLDTMGDLFPDTEAWVSGHQALENNLELPPNVKLIPSLQKCVHRIHKLQQQQIRTPLPKVEA